MKIVTYDESSVIFPRNTFEKNQNEQCWASILPIGCEFDIIFHHTATIPGTNTECSYIINFYNENLPVKTITGTKTVAYAKVSNIIADVVFDRIEIIPKLGNAYKFVIPVRVITDFEHDLKRIDFYKLGTENALFKCYEYVNFYKTSELANEREIFTTSDRVIIPTKQKAFTKYNVVFGGVSGMHISEAEALNNKIGLSDYIMIDGGIFQIDTPPKLTPLSSNRVNVVIGGYFTTERNILQEFTIDIPEEGYTTRIEAGATILFGENAEIVGDELVISGNVGGKYRYFSVMLSNGVLYHFRQQRSGSYIPPAPEEPAIFDFLRRIKRINYGITLTPKI